MLKTMKDPQGNLLELIFTPGSFVSWKRLGNTHREYGYIIRLGEYRDKKVSSCIPTAAIQKTNGEIENFPLSYLKLEAK